MWLRMAGRFMGLRLSILSAKRVKRGKMNEAEYFSIGWNDHRKRVHLMDDYYSLKTKCGREMNIGKRRNKDKVILGRCQTMAIHYKTKTIKMHQGCVFCKR